MVGNGHPRRLKSDVIEMIKKTGAWEAGEHIGDAIKFLSLYCLEDKIKFRKWLEKKKKKLKD